MGYRSACREFSPQIWEMLRTQSTQFNTEFYETLFNQYIGITENFLSIILTLCWYTSDFYQINIRDIISRWSSLRSRNHPDFDQIPALLLIYVIEVASVYRSKWSILDAVLETKGVILPNTQKRFLSLRYISKSYVFDWSNNNRSFDGDRRSVFIKNTIYPFFKAYIPNEQLFTEVFDLTEMILAVLLTSRHNDWIDNNAVYYDFDSQWEHIFEFWRDGGKLGEDWQFLIVFFDGDVSKLESALEKYRDSPKQRNYGYSSRIKIPDLFEIYKGN